jgi:hypothetical protein
MSKLKIRKLKKYRKFEFFVWGLDNTFSNSKSVFRNTVVYFGGSGDYKLPDDSLKFRTNLNCIY